MESQATDIQNEDVCLPKTTTSRKPGVIVTIRSQPNKHGAFHKLRFLQFSEVMKASKAMSEALIRTVPPSPSEAIARELLASYKYQEARYQLFAYGDRFADHVVQRVGQSITLDSAIECIVHAYASMRRSELSSQWINKKLYAQALHRLQRSLENPSECYATETLCATLILGILETRFGTHESFNHIMHAGGIAALLEKRGPRAFNDPLFAMVVVSSSGQLMNYAFTKGQDSLLSLPEWQEIIFSKNWPGAQGFVMRLQSHMVFWPNLARQVANCRRAETPEASRSLLRRISETLCAVEQMEVELVAHLNDGTWATQHGSKYSDSLTPLSYDFPNPECAAAYTYHAAFCIALKRMIGALDDSPGVLTNLETAILFYSQRIWMSYEYAKPRSPFGGDFIITPLLLSFESASAAMIPRLVESINGIAENKGKGGRRMNEDAARYLSESVTGRVDINMQEYLRSLRTQKADISSLQESS